MVQIAWQDLPATDVGSCSSQRELGIRGNPLKRPTVCAGYCPCVQVIARLKKQKNCRHVPLATRISNYMPCIVY